MGEICRENGLWLISDEIHCDLLRNGMQHIPMAKVMPDYDRLITCMAASKTFNMAGFMFANVIIRSPELMEVWKERHFESDNPLSITATQAAYTDGGEWLEQLHVYLDENFRFMKEYLEKHLPKAVFRIPEATYLAWVDINAYLPDEDSLPLFFANHAGVLLEGGNMFVQNSDGFIRLNVACPRAMLETGLERICKALSEKA